MKTFNVRVKKPFSNLEPGDVLNFDENKSEYYIYKEDSEFDGKSSLVKRSYICIPAYIINYTKDTFEFIDKYGNTIEAKEIEYSDIPVEYLKNKPENVNESIPYKTIDDLQKQIDDLTKELNTFKQTPKDNFYFTQYRSIPMFTLW